MVLETEVLWRQFGGKLAQTTGKEEDMQDEHGKIKDSIGLA